MISVMATKLLLLLLLGSSPEVLGTCFRCSYKFVYSCLAVNLVIKTPKQN